MQREPWLSEIKQACATMFPLPLWMKICRNAMRGLNTVCLLQVLKHYKCQKKGKCVTYFSVFGMWIQPLHNFTSHVFSYLQPWQQKALNCSANYTAPFVSQAKQEIRLLSARDGIKKHLVSSVLSNPILTPSHIPMWGCAAPQNRLGNGTICRGSPSGLP